MDIVAGGSTANETDNRPTISIGTFGLFVLFFGWLGIHDFGMRWWKHGCIHLLMVLLGIILLVFSVSSFLGPTLIVGSWVLAFGEFFYYRNKDMWRRADQVKDFLVTARVTGVLTSLMILPIGYLIYAIIAGKKCYTSGCDGAGWAIVFIIWFGFIPLVVDIICTVKTFKLRKKLSEQQLSDKSVVRSTIGVACLSVIIAILLASAFIVAIVG